MGVKNFKHGNNNLNYKIPKKYSVSLDASMFYTKNNNCLSPIQSKLEVGGLLFKLLLGATEIFICWDGQKPLQKQQCIFERNKSKTEIILNNKYVVCRTLIKYLYENLLCFKNNIKKIMYDLDESGEGEWKIIKFNGWNVKVTAVFVVANDNDCFYGLYNQPFYKVNEKNFVDISTIPLVPIVEEHESDKRYKGPRIIKISNYEGSYEFPRFKFDFKYGVLDYWNCMVHNMLEAGGNTGNCCASKHPNDSYNVFDNNNHQMLKWAFDNYKTLLFECCMFAHIIAFGNDYNKPILMCDYEKQRNIFYDCSKFLFTRQNFIRCVMNQNVSENVLDKTDNQQEQQVVFKKIITRSMSKTNPANTEDTEPIKKSPIKRKKLCQDYEEFSTKFDLIDFLIYILPILFSRKRVKENDGCLEFAPFYYYRLLWNFLYTKFTITNIKGIKLFTFPRFNKQENVVELCKIVFNQFSAETILVVPTKNYSNENVILEFENNLLNDNKIEVDIPLYKKESLQMTLKKI